MESANHITKPHALRSGADTANRAAALRARIRELRDEAIVDQPRDESAKVSDTRPSSTTEIGDDDFASLARLVDRAHVDATPTVPGTAPALQGGTASRMQWRHPIPHLAGESAVSFADARRPATKGLLPLAPVWLISAVVHAGLLVTLALLTYSQTSMAPAILIAANHADPAVLLDDDIEIGRTDREPEPPWSDSEGLDPNPLTADTTELEVSCELAATQIPIDLQYTTMLSEQLSAAQKINVSGDLRQAARGMGAQFYGIQAEGNRFVFIVDSSTSMRLKFAEAKRELEYAVRRLREDQLFYVIFFDRDAERLRLGKWNAKGTRYSMKTRSEPDLVPANIENINALIYWMNTIQLDSDTNPYPAVVYALRKLAPDAIFLLSDGEFNDGGSTEAFLQRENIIDHPTEGLTPKTIVHCVGFYSRQGEITLKRVAAANGGTYRFIEPPRMLMPMMNPLFGGKGPMR